MPNTTSNYALYKPLVNDATDEDLWGGYLNDSMDLIDTQMKVNADAIAASVSGELPVGSIYSNDTVSTNPGTLLGYGTWVAITDKMVIGASGTYAAGTTGGSATHTLTVGEMPNHAHTSKLSNGFGANADEHAAGGGGGSGNGLTTSGSLAISTSSAGSGSAHSILNPYHSAYIWRRTV